MGGAYGADPAEEKRKKENENKEINLSIFSKENKKILPLEAHQPSAAAAAARWLARRRSSAISKWKTLNF